MSEVLLETVEHWAAVSPGDPVRLTRGTLQVNGVVDSVEFGEEESAVGLCLVEIAVMFAFADGWLLERPVVPDPLPTVEGSVIRVTKQGGRVRVLQLDHAVGGAPVWIDAHGSWRKAAEVWDGLISWEWVRKPEQLVVQETRTGILSAVLDEFDARMPGEESEAVTELRNALVMAVTRGRAA